MPTEQAVAIYRTETPANPACLTDFAAALNNLGVRYGASDRHEEAVAPTEEAVAIYRTEAASNPVVLPRLAETLNNLGIRYAAVGRDDEVDQAWEEAIAAIPDPEGRDVLARYRRGGQDAGDS